MVKRSRTEIKEETKGNKHSKKKVKGKKEDKESQHDGTETIKDQKRPAKKKEESSTLVSKASKLPPVTEKSEETVFTKKNVDLVVSLLPSTLGKTQSSVEDSIRQMLLKYSDGVGGILLAFENVKITVDKYGLGQGWISNELPYVHYNVSCDALVFCPRIGCKVSGVINECFPSHIGILVYSYFNAMVSAENLRACGYSFDHVLQNWVTEGGNQSLSNEDHISFIVEKMHECDGTVSLEGTNPSLALLVDT